MSISLFIPDDRDGECNGCDGGPPPKSAPLRRGPRQPGDPKYVRRMRNKWMAIPYRDGFKNYLGLYKSEFEALRAVRLFEMNLLRPKPRFAFKVRAREPYYEARVAVCGARDRAAERRWNAAAKEARAEGRRPPGKPPVPAKVRLTLPPPGGGRGYPTAEAAHAAAVAWLAREVGPLVAWAMARGERGWTDRDFRPEGRSA